MSDPERYGGGGWLIDNRRIGFVSGNFWGLGGGWLAENPKIDFVSGTL